MTYWLFASFFYLIIHVSIFFIIFLYLCVSEAIWILLWTMKGIMWCISLLWYSMLRHFFQWKWGLFRSLSFNLNPYQQKTPDMLYTIRFEILSRLWIRNFHLPKMTCQILIMLYSLKKAWVQVFYYMLLVSCLKPAKWPKWQCYLIKWWDISCLPCLKDGK